MDICVSAVGGLLRVLALQPLRLHYFWARIMSRILAGPLHYRRDVVMINLARSFPEKKYHELKEIADKFYRHLGRVVAEAIWFAGSRNVKRFRKTPLCHYVNPEVPSELFDTTPSVMIMTSHVGNWEIMGGCVNYPGISASETSIREKDITIVYKALTSKTWDKIMKNNRCAPVKADWNECCIESQDIMRYVIRHHGQKRVYVFPTDQCPYKYASVHTVDDFMHQPTKTMTGGAALARKFHMSVCYMGMKEREEGGYDITFTEICRDASEMTPEEMMNRFYSLLQKDIEEQPWNYLWTHKRWKK